MAARHHHSMGFRTVSLFSAFTIFASASAGGIAAISSTVGEAIQQALRKPAGAYTQQPFPAFLGSHPGRDARTRGGVWSKQALKDAEAEQAPLEASMEPSFIVQKVAVYSVYGGSTFPWEGSDVSAAGSINTNTGNKLTAIPLVSWTARGGMPVAFTLYHNSQDTASAEFGKGWSWSYNIYINASGSGATVHWGDGLSIPYGLSGGSYVAPAGIHDALVHNGTGTWTLTKKSGVKYQFNSSGFLTAIQDRNGNQLTFTLGSGNFCTAITDPSGRQITFSISSGKYTSMTDPLGRTWNFTRNISDCLTTVTWPILDGSSYTDGFTYDGSGRILTHTDRRGKVWSNTYNTNGSLATETDPLSHSKTYTYASSSTTITDALGHATVDNYSSGIMSSQQDAAGFSENYTSRDSDRNPLTVVDRRGKTWTRTYDSLGNVLTVTDPLSHATTYTYNGFSQVLTETDALSHTTTKAYDTNGNLLTVTDPLGHVSETNTYDSYGQMVTSKNALNHTYTAARDTDGNVTSVTDPLSHVTSMTYNGLGLLLSRTDPLSHTESVAYDNWLRPVTYTHADGTTETTAYNAVGAITAATDELSHTTTYGYDNAGRLTSVTNARGDTESYGYDVGDHRTTVTNGRGKVSTYTYTNRGEVASLTLPDGSSESWSYDGEGNNTAYTNALSQTILNVYDDAQRQTKVDYPSGTDTTLGYDNADRQTSMVDSTGTTTWTFDNADRLTSLATPQGTISYTYDNADRRATMVDATGTTTYTLDNAGRVTSLQNPFSETTNWTYDDADRVTRTTFSSGQYDDFGYDSRDRETSIAHRKADNSLIESESYVFDNAGNLTSKTVGGTTTTYTYDAIDQLLTESRFGYSASYTYDANGNRATKTLGGVTQTYTVDDADKLLNVKQGATTIKSYGYDTAGRTTSVVSAAGTTTLAYDYEDRVSTITYPSTATNTFAYNGLDARVSKVDSTGTFTYRRDGAEATDSVLADGAATYTPGISERRSGTTRFDLQDQLGSVTRQTNTSGTTTATKSYDAYGMLLSFTGTPTGPFGFAGAHGYQEDSDSGLDLLGHRYYDSSTGRFLTRDSERDGRNWYAYCDNNPLSQVDPTGLYLQAKSDPGLQAAEKGRETIENGGGPPDCGDFVSDCYDGVYPAPGRDKSANEFPGWFKKHPEQWEQVPNDKNYKPKPGDVLVTQRKKGHGHVRMVGVDKNGKPVYIDASIGYERPKKDKKGRPIKDKKGKPVMETVPPRKPSKSSTQRPRGGETIWRPKGKK